MNRSVFSLLLFLLVFGLPNLVSAQIFLGSVSKGAGGAGIASVEPVESIFINPAVLPHAMDFETGLFYEDGEVTPEKHKTSWGLSFVDNTEGILVPGGVAYISTRETHLNQKSTNGSLWQASIGNFIYEQLSIGLSFYRDEQREDGGDTYTQWNSTLGFLFNPKSDIAVGFVYYNLAGGDMEAPEHLRLLPMWGLGVNYILSQFARIRIDYKRATELNPENKPEYGFGVESLLQNFFVFRIGGLWDEREDQRYITTGLSFNGPRMKLDYAFFKNTKRSQGALHSVNLRIPF